MKKEIPLLFSSVMVSAILDGRKTMTRRTIKHTVNNFPNEWNYQLYGGMAIGPHADRKHQFIGGAGCYSDVKCPYGKPGDILWVRESFMPFDTMEGESEELDEDQLPLPAYSVQFGYKAGGRMDAFVSEDYYNRAYDLIDIMEQEGEKWKPSIHMPKSAARIWLEVTEVRVERLKDITEEDAVKEGVEQNPDGSWHDYVSPTTLWQYAAQPSFKSLWLKINGPESWNANPWVFVVSFKVLSTTGRPEAAQPKEVRHAV